MNTPVTLSVNNYSYTTYQWLNGNGNNIAGATNSSYSTSVPGNYSVRVTKSTATYTSPPFAVKKGVGAQNLNYIVSNSIRVSNVTSLSAVEDLPVASNSQSIQYFDALGRAMQTVVTQGSPLKKDIVQPVVYDNYDRQFRNYLPYVSSEFNGWHKANAVPNTPAENGNYGSSPHWAFYNNNPNGKVAQDAAPYGEAVYELSERNRIVKQGAPGVPWQPNSDPASIADKSIKNFPGANVANEVLSWTYNTSTDRPENGSGATRVYFNANQLSQVRTLNEDNDTTIVYTDKLGRVVLTKAQYASSRYTFTYYVYDDLGNLRVVIPPEAAKRLDAEYHQATTANKDKFLNLWAYRYKYDNRNRLVQKQLPGAKPVYLVYDNRDRVILTQDGNQRRTLAGALKKEWLFTKYDAWNRPVMTGLYVHALNDTAQIEMQTYVNAQMVSGNQFYEDYNSTATTTHGYTNRTFPSITSAGAIVFSVNYYDNYQFITPLINNGNGSITTYNYQTGDIPGQETQNFLRTRGQITGIKINVLGSSSYLWTVTYYDDKYRPIQTITQNYKGGVDRATNKYDFVSLLETKVTHVNGANTFTTKRRADYDHMGRVLKTYHTFNMEPEVILTQNEYNELGQLVNKKLHSRSGSPFVQSTDFVYNIRGWLQKINDPSAPEAGDLFSMELKYNTPTVNGGTAQFNGNVSESIWKSVGLDVQSYGYYYDTLDRIKESRYFNASRPLNNGRYTEKIGGINVKGYDLNGNILKLNRYGKKDASTFGLMDDLVYSVTGNKLTRVDDAITLNNNEEGFKESTKAANEYTFDANGSILKDDNKGVTDITYNHLNLPVQVNKGPSDYVVYTYDASGRKLSQQVFGSTAKTTDYIGEFIYENNVLVYALHEEGRIVPDNAPGAPRPWEYQYFLKDHLGNVRTTFSEKKSTTQYDANMEASTNTSFLNYGSRSGLPLFNHTSSGTYSQLINGGNNSQVGLAKSFEVNPGDIVDLEVFAKYESPGSGSNTPNALVNSLISAFNLSTGGGTPLEGPQAYNAFNSMFSPGPYIGRVPPYEDAGAPRAYLNYILFDQNFNLVDFGFDQISDNAEQVGVSPVVAHDFLSLHVKVQQKGYLYVFLSNEQPVPTNVYFDDMKITHNTGVEQVSEYFPFGLQISSQAYNKQGMTKNPLGYNGKEMQDELNLGWLDYGARMYMADIARWGVADPLAEKTMSLTPYRYGFNNPLSFTDPTGMSEQYVRGGYGEMIAMGDTEGHSGAVYNSSGEQTAFTQTTAANGSVSYSWQTERQIQNTLIDIFGDLAKSLSEFSGDNSSAKDPWDEAGVEQQDESTKFHWFENEGAAYSFMVENSKEKEIVGYGAVNTKTDKLGILILPWKDNKRDESDPSIGVKQGGNVITDYDGNVYRPFFMVHTHPDWLQESDADLSSAFYWEAKYPEFRSFIINKGLMYQYYPHHVQGLTFLQDYVDGKRSLLPKK